MVNIGNAPKPKVPRHYHQVNCFQQGMLEFEGPMGQCFSRFPTVSSGRRGGKKIRDWQEEWMNPNSHIPHLQAQLAFAWHNRLVLDRRLSAVLLYSRCSQPTLQRRYEGVHRSIANTHWHNILRSSRPCWYHEVVWYSVAGSSSSHELF